MISFLKLIRFKNLLMVLLTMVLTKYALIDSIVTASYPTTKQFIIFCLSLLFITAGGYILNDIFDVEADRINKPDKVYIENVISKKSAWSLYVFFTLIGLITGLYLSFSMNSSSLSYVYFYVIAGLFCYSFYFKRVAFVGNLIVSTFISLTIILLYLFHGSYSRENNLFDGIYLFYVIISYSIFAGLTTMIRELLKDIEDIDGDYKIKAKTLPIILGVKRTKSITLVFTFILIVLLILFSTSIFGTPKYIFWVITITVTIPLVYFFYELWNANTKKQFHFLSNLMKIIMLLGILSMLLFKFM